MNVKLTPEAISQLAEIREIDPKSARIIFKHIKKLPQLYQTDPHLQGDRFKHLQRNRSGRYRIIYRVLRSEQKIEVITVGNRKPWQPIARSPRCFIRPGSTISTAPPRHRLTAYSK